MITQTAGRAGVTVTSAAAVAMLSVDTASASTAAGVSLPVTASWTLQITTTQDVAVNVYAAVGANCGLVLIAGWSATATSVAPYSLSVTGQPYQRIYATAQASSTTATVNCDFLAQSQVA